MAHAGDFRRLPLHGLVRLRRDAFPRVPPFVLEGMSVRMFPLRAELSALQTMCDRHLNSILPPVVGRFSAAAPYAFLLMVDYGRLSETETNLGWFAQKEIAFCFPASWYKLVDNRWRFHDWAVLTPFIYVDDDLSVPLGRQVYGWGKTGARLTPTLGRWIEDPRADLLEARVETMVYPELYEGRELRSEVFLELEREASTSLSQYPPDPRMPFAPWNVWWNVSRATMGWMRDLEGWLGGLGLFPTTPGGAPHNLAALTTRLAQFFRPDGAGAVWNTLNVKQFRLAQEPERACYQALTNGPMRIRSLRGAGGLGQSRVLAGDASGGYGIKIHEWPSVPIVDSLGLEVDRRWQGSGTTVALLRPVLPFWYEVDMEYLDGRNVAWRSDDGRWRDERGRPVGSATTPKPSETAYNTAATSSPDPIVGPFEFWNTTLRVLPLLARRAALEKFLKEYLGELEGDVVAPDDGVSVRFVPWAAGTDYRGAHDRGPRDDGIEDDDLAYVYMTASSFGAVTSDTNNIGDWAKYEVSFLIPVMYQTKSGGSKTWESQSVGLVPAYTFVDTTAAAIARGEVLGVPTATATFVRPDSAWLSDEVPLGRGRQVLLRVEADVLPALREGRATESFGIVEISEQTGDAQRVDARTDLDIERWVTTVRKELERKKRTKSEHNRDTKEDGRVRPGHYRSARAVALERIGRTKTFAFYTLKQFEDAQASGRACYSALVRFHRGLSRVLDLREIESLITVRIRDFPSLSIARDLGIVGSRVQEDSAGITYETHPIRPFFVTGTLTESLGTRMIWRVGDRGTEDEHGWQTDPTGKWRHPDFRAVPTSRKDWPGPEGKLDQLPELGDPRRIELLIDLLLEGEVDPDAELKHEGAMKALEVIDAQILIESLLSREWGNRHEGVRWLRTWKRLRREYELALSGVDENEVVDTETKLFCSLLARADLRPGRVRAEYAHTIIPATEWFSGQLVGLDRDWRVLSAYLNSREHDRDLDVGVGDEQRLHGAADDLCGYLARIAEHDVVGYPFAPDDWVEHAGTRADELQARLDALLKNKLVVIMNERDVKDNLWHTRAELREAVSLAHAIGDLQREALLMKVSKIEQKPDFCLLREMAGARKDELFPLTWSWDEDWFFGPPLESPPSPSPSLCEGGPDDGAREKLERRERYAREVNDNFRAQQAARGERASDAESKPEDGARAD